MFKKDLTKIERKQDERVTENNSAAYIANLETRVQIEKAQTLLSTANVPTNGAPAQIDQTNYFNTTLSLNDAANANGVSGNFLRRNQNILGLPIKDQTETVNQLLSTNAAIKAQAESLQRDKEAEEQVWKAKEEKYRQKLEDFGAKYEEERNAKIVKYFKWGGILLLLIGGPIALCVLFPPLIGGLIGFIPQLATIFNVVPKAALHSVVKGIGETRNVLKSEIDTIKEQKLQNPNTQPITYTSEEVLQLIDDNLVRPTAKYQTLIDHARNKTNV